jgi:hypothetical protein
MINLPEGLRTPLLALPDRMADFERSPGGTLAEAYGALKSVSRLPVIA